MAPLFQLPDEVLLSPILARFPCRENQIRSLATLLSPTAAPCPNLIIHGTEATGKSAITAAVLAALSSSDDVLRYAIINSTQCITARHLFQRIIGAVATALDWAAEPARRCESLAQLSVELQRMMEGVARKLAGRRQIREGRAAGGADKGICGDQADEVHRFVLVLDGVDRQRDAPVTLLPGLARIPEMIPSLTCVFVVTVPQPSLLRTAATPHVLFPAYTKPEFVSIMKTTAPSPTATASINVDSDDDGDAADSSELWARFCAAVHDTLVLPAARTLPALQTSCRALWPRFTAPIRAGTIGPKEFSKLLIAARVHFQDESLLCPSMVTVQPEQKAGNPYASASAPSSAPVSRAHTPATTPTKKPAAAASGSAAATGTPDLSALLPRTARLVLLAAYIASHNASKHDLVLFSTFHHGRRRRHGGGFAASRGATSAAARYQRGKHRKIARRLLGAHVFVLERMLAIHAAVRSEWVGGSAAAGMAAGGGLDGDVAMAVSTLATLRLLVRVGAAHADVMDRGGKWRINVGWDMVRGMGRSMGLEVEEWLIE